MRSVVHGEIQQQPGQPVAPAAAARAASAEAAQLDARLELAAKKAALRNLEAQAGGGDAPAVGVTGSGSVTVTQGDKTFTIENPTAEQLAQLTGSTQQGPPLEGWQAVAITSTVMWALVAMVWMVLRHRRRGATAVPARQSDEMAARMARIENAIESVAVEVERISEGQRFTARLLSEGAAVPIGVADRIEAVPENRAGR